MNIEIENKLLLIMFQSKAKPIVRTKERIKSEILEKIKKEDFKNEIQKLRVTIRNLPQEEKDLLEECINEWNN